MSAITTHAPVVRQPATEACWRCGESVASDGNADPVHCPSCRRFDAHIAFSDALAALKALRAGSAPFDVLSPGERAEQIEQLIGVDELADRMLAEVGNPLRLIPEPELLRQMRGGDDAALAVTAELLNRANLAGDLTQAASWRRFIAVMRGLPNEPLVTLAGHTADEIGRRLGSVDEPIYQWRGSMPTAEEMDDVLGREEAAELEGDRFDGQS